MPQDSSPLNDYSPRQIEKAIQLIEDRAIMPLTISEGAYVAVSSDGTQRYSVVPAGNFCTCPAGNNGLRCYHLAAAHALAAGTRELLEV